MPSSAAAAMAVAPAQDAKVNMAAPAKWGVHSFIANPRMWWSQTSID
jgi:hypothetical protein